MSAVWLVVPDTGEFRILVWPGEQRLHLYAGALRPPVEWERRLTSPDRLREYAAAVADRAAGTNVEVDLPTPTTTAVAQRLVPVLQAAVAAALDGWDAAAAEYPQMPDLVAAPPPGDVTDQEREWVDRVWPQAREQIWLDPNDIERYHDRSLDVPRPLPQPER